jgi:hypothetical protein
MHLKRRMEFSQVHTDWDRGAILAEPERTQNDSERRAHRRYAIVTDLNYRIVRNHRVLEQGSGQTVDISTSGICFECGQVLPLGRKVEVSILWPSGPMPLRRMELVAEGRVIRAHRNLVVMMFKRYAFREISKATATA